MKTTEEKLNAFLSQYSEDEQERIIQYALDHVIPRMKRKAHTSQPKQDQDKPVAVVTGMYGGRFIVEPTNRAMVLPDNMALYAQPQQRKPVKFPTMLRKMWSGGDVQAWLDENVNKE